MNNVVYAYLVILRDFTRTSVLSVQWLFTNSLLYILIYWLLLHFTYVLTIKSIYFNICFAKPFTLLQASIHVHVVRIP